SDVRSPAAAFARRPHHLDQRRRRLLAVQSQEGQPDVGRIEDVAVAKTVPADGAAPAPQRPAVPAQLPARELAGLSLLGHRTRPISVCARRRLNGVCTMRSRRAPALLKSAGELPARETVPGAAAT